MTCPLLISAGGEQDGGAEEGGESAPLHSEVQGRSKLWPERASAWGLEIKAKRFVEEYLVRG